MISISTLKAIAVIALSSLLGGIVKVLFSISNKEGKKWWEHLLTLLIVSLIGLVSAFALFKAGIHDKWYASALLFVMGYGYDKFLIFLNKKIPDILEKIVDGYLDKKHNSKENIDENN